MGLGKLWPFGGDGGSKRSVKKELQQLMLRGDYHSLTAASERLKKHRILIGEGTCSDGATLWHLAAQSGVSALGMLCDLFLGPFSPYADLPQHELHAKLRKKLDSGDAFGRTPLMLACAHGQVHAALWLISMGANAFRGDPNGLTCVHYAARLGQTACLKAVLDSTTPDTAPPGVLARSLKDVSSLAGLSPLHHAVACNKVQCVRVLLDYEVNIAAKSVAATSELGTVYAPGSTSLHVAAMMGSVAMATILLGGQLQQSPEQSIDLRRMSDTFGRLPIQILRACEPHTQRRMLQLLDPNSDLQVLLAAVEPVYSGTGAPKLQNIAAAAVRRKLAADLDAVAEAITAAGRSPSLAKPSAGLEHVYCPLPSDEVFHKSGDPDLTTISTSSARSKRGAKRQNSVACCSICYERAPEVQSHDCGHAVCIPCAQQICSKAVDRPPACPFCRAPIDKFEAYAASQPPVPGRLPG